jgi:hypothetical protein
MPGRLACYDGYLGQCRFDDRGSPMDLVRFLTNLYCGFCRRLWEITGK